MQFSRLVAGQWVTTSVVAPPSDSSPGTRISSAGRGWAPAGESDQYLAQEVSLALSSLPWRSRPSSGRSLTGSTQGVANLTATRTDAGGAGLAPTPLAHGSPKSWPRRQTTTCARPRS